ncbi:MAG: ABC transporter transmembrane domain-containing protein [Trueperaceae bacterium]|nr:ABC transporter transmembrane domain-containing protein [Trueperaceae bacterium]
MPERPEPRAPRRRGRPDLRQIRRLLAFTRPYRLQLITALVATLIAGLVQLAFPLLSRDLFNDAFAAAGADADTAASAAPGRIALLLVAIFALQAGFNFLRVYLLGLVGEGVVADLRTRLFSHLMDLSPAFFLRRKTGEITSRLASDVGTVQSLVSNALAQFVNQLVTLVGGAAALLFINARLTLVMLAVVPPVIIGGAVVGRRLRRLSREFQDQVADANADAEEAIANIRIVQSFTGEAVERARYRAGIDAAWRSAKRRVRVRAVFVPSVILAMFTGVTLVLWYGGRQVLAGSLAPGDLIAFLLLTLFIAGSVATFTGLFAQLQEGLGASRRIFELLDERPDLPVPTVPTPLPDGPRDVRFEHVWFRYDEIVASSSERNADRTAPGGSEASGGEASGGEASGAEPEDAATEPWVLRDVDLAIRPGEVVALVGPSGAGKSTLASLLPRFFDPQQGAVRLGGVDLRDADPAEVRAQVGLVPQETQLFSGSVADNVRYGRPDASDDELMAAAEAAHAAEFVRALPDGWDTLVGERGLRLSGGQRQRIAIARALLKDPGVLVLDEATSSLDSESEALIQDALERLMRGRTSLVIAHRLSTVVGADRIVVLQGGRIVQIGRHEQLVATDGLYRTLFETQFRKAGTATGGP